jgi:hypothetical protein
MSKPHVFRDGGHYAISPDGQWWQKVGPGEQLEPGWRLMTDEEWEAEIDEVVEQVCLDLVAEKAHLN